MAKLKYVEMFLDGSYSTEEKKKFLFSSRCYCNYLEWFLIEKDIDSEFSRINIFCTKDKTREKVDVYKKEKSIEIVIYYDVGFEENLSEKRLQEIYIEVSKKAFEVAFHLVKLESKLISEIADKFRGNGYKNVWIQAEKVWRSWSLRGEVVASLTMNEFNLVRNIYKDGNLIDSRVICETVAREGVFESYLGVLVMDRLKNIVYKKNGNVISTISISELGLN